ncbi:MAG TPA: OmpA family protein [Burkholderiales bacterium]|nr:OmpA family protein [Burkholderiales bacterium]
MKNCFSTKFAVLAAGLLMSSGVALGHNAGEEGTATTGHLRDSSGHPVKNTGGECWHIAAITPDPECAVQPAAPPPAPVAAPAPAPVAPAPVAKPAPQAVKQKVTLQADALFDFNKAVLKPEGKKAIDQALETRAKQNYTIESVLATGHTDGIGTDSYNDKLSLRRAQAVKDYMASKGLEANKITVEGKGKRQPVAENKTKQGRSKNRRVDIEFTGFQGS